MAALSETGRAPDELVADIERSLEKIERLPDDVVRTSATAVVQALLELYGAGLTRIVEEIAARDDGSLAQALIEDELVSHLLLLHGLHPVPLAERVLGALDGVRPYLESHGGNVELLEVDEPVVRLRMQGSCSGCPSSAVTLKLAIEDAIHKAAPEIEEVLAEDGAPRPRMQAGPLLQIERVQPEGAWTTAGGLRELDRGGTAVKVLGGRAILFLRVGRRLYGYGDRCAACAQSLAGATLRGSRLTCAGCGNRYDVLRAGRCIDEPEHHLDPVPLLVDDDELVRVAVAVAA